MMLNICFKTGAALVSQSDLACRRSDERIDSDMQANPKQVSEALLELDLMALPASSPESPGWCRIR
jgi:hypothetical protein